MIRPIVSSIAIGLFALSMAGDAESVLKNVTWTGWFSDADCAAGRVASGKITATNPECAKQCIEKGIAPVFISEQTKSMFTVKDRDVVEDLGYHVEVQAHVDEAAKTIEIQKVTRLGEAGVACARPKKINF
jgi:hypothetical protein